VPCQCGIRKSEFLSFEKLEIIESNNSCMSKGHILVVEDNIDNYELVRFILERAGYDVFLAMNGRDGVAAARFQKPDLILMDLTMPEMDGWLAAEKLKADEVTKSIPLYALSAHTLPSERKRALAAGCDGYVSKPIHMAGFLEIIDQVFGIKETKKAGKSCETI
jgi:two-component system, cell cycle response regulator DivK